MKKYLRVLLIALVILVCMFSCEWVEEIASRLPYDIEGLHLHSWDNWALVYDDANVNLVCSICDENVISYPISQGLEIKDGVVVGRGTCKEEYIVVPQGVTAIGEGAFSHEKDILGVLLPESVTEIRDGAFENCDGLQVINIPEGVTTIGDNAFFSCKALIGVVIPNSVKSIGRKAFSNCGYLEIIYYVGTEEEWNAVSKGNDWDKGAGKHVVEFKMVVGDNEKPEGDPDDDSKDFRFVLNEDGQSYSVFGIGSYKNSILQIPNIHKGLPVTRIGENAFVHNYSIISVIIPASITIIDSSAFAGCTSLVSVEFEEDCQLTNIEEWVFYDCTSLISIAIPDSVLSIGESAFEDCYSLLSVKIGNSVTSIGDSAFEWCSSLISVEIGDSVTSIGVRAFNDCRSLANLVIPDSVTSIGSDAFLSCHLLTSVEIGNSVRSIGSNAFADCSSLTSVVIPDSVTSIGYEAFRYCNSLTRVIIPDTVTSIDYDAFCDCISLTIYCEAELQPDGWNCNWNPDNRPVFWGYTGE